MDGSFLIPLLNALRGVWSVASPEPQRLGMLRALLSQLHRQTPVNDSVFLDIFCTLEAVLDPRVNSAATANMVCRRWCISVCLIFTGVVIFTVLLLVTTQPDELAVVAWDCLRHLSAVPSFDGSDVAVTCLRTPGYPCPVYRSLTGCGRACTSFMPLIHRDVL
jgi:hypothetical protein